MRKPTHGHCIGKNSRTYKSWLSMWERCTNVNYPRFNDHGGRGIKVCDQWKVFQCFLDDMGTRPDGKSLDRKDNDGDYTPSNCVWSTPKEQCRNRRNNRIIIHNGHAKCLTEWSELTGIGKHTIKERINRGWSVKRALETPV